MLTGQGQRPDWTEERRVWEQGAPWAIGADEAGRGPLAGPLVVATVAVPAGFTAPWLAAVRDSKLLAPSQRARLAEAIARSGLPWAVGQASVAEIDQLGLTRALALALRRAVAALPKPVLPPEPGPSPLLVDGLPLPALGLPHRAIVDGDARCFSIAIASILAKVERDRIMEAEDARYPLYGFARHKGYPTPEHLRALHEHGPCPIHRRSFAPVRLLLKDQP